MTDVDIETLISAIHEGATRIEVYSQIGEVHYKVTAYYVPSADVIRVDLREVD